MMISACHLLDFPRAETLRVIILHAVQSRHVSLILASGRCYSLLRRVASLLLTGNNLGGGNKLHLVDID